MNKVRTAVIGAGKMGSIHAKVYDSLGQSDFIAVVDIVANKAQRLADQYNCLAATSSMDILDKVDAVTIATPTVTHMEVAKIFMEEYGGRGGGNPSNAQVGGITDGKQEAHLKEVANFIKNEFGR